MRQRLGTARLAACVLTLAACTDLNLPNGHLICSTDTHLCPPGYHCAQDHCWLDGTDPGPPDLTSTIDLAPTDGGPDLTSLDLTTTDLTSVDLTTVDLTTTDLTTVDLTTTDLTTIDLTSPPDFTATDAAIDFAMPDSAVSDLTMPDLTTIDLTTPDLTTSDLSKPDLSMPDMSRPPDLAQSDGGIIVSLTPNVTWMSGCGGTAVAPSTNRLDVSAFGTLSAGTVTAPSGNQLQTGYLPLDTR